VASNRNPSPKPAPDTGPEPLRDIAPAEPIAPFLGGKRLLAKRIIARIEAVPHRCYAEPFVGMGGVFLRRPKRPKVEAINDVNGEIANLFRILREHPDELAQQFRWAVASRHDFRRLVKTPPEVLTDVQRAARFAYLQTLAFAGKLDASGMALGPYYPCRFRTERILGLIAAAHRRLQGVHIEALDWREFLRRYDKPFTLFYLDPPYWGHETDYGRGIFAREDFAAMAELLRGLKGRFILSLNDRPEVRETFGGFDFETVGTTYTANAKRARAVGEVLIVGG